MTEADERKPRPSRPRTPACLREDTFEQIISSGLNPRFIPEGKHVIVIMPPLDATSADDKEYPCNGSVIYFAPNGGDKRKGVEKEYKVTLDEANRLKGIQAAILEEKGLPTT